MTSTSHHTTIPVDLKGLTPQEIERFCTEELGQKAGQGTRVAVWLFRRTVEEFDSMEDLGRSFRKLLKERCTISSLAIERSIISEDGTIKLLYGLEDGHAVEGVLIPGSGRLTLCISSQVGCASGCGFCRTGEGGFIRNLTTAEIMNQFFVARKHGGGKQISNIVLMGTGEPLGNYDNVKSFVETAVDQSGLGFSGKKITLSTCGLAPMIEKMAGEMEISLAVSLNATTDEVRNRIMPVNKAYPIARLMQALRYYCDRTGRSVTIEYVLFKDINDSDEDAKRLMNLLEGLPCMVNVLTFNPFPSAAFEPPPEERTYAFRNILLNNGFVAVVRDSRGKDIHAACGQLRAASPPATGS